MAIYHGDSEPKAPTEFLDDFITELLNSMANKTIENKSYNNKVLGFVCDTPARAFMIKFELFYYKRRAKLTK